MTNIVLARYHAQLMHCGYEKIYLTLKQRAYWTNMYADTRKCFTVRDMPCCKGQTTSGKSQYTNSGCPTRNISESAHGSRQNHPENATHKYTHALVLIDANSLCCELIPVKSTSAAETCRIILREWIAHYGVFSELVTDRHA